MAVLVGLDLGCQGAIEGAGAEPPSPAADARRASDAASSADAPVDVPQPPDAAVVDAAAPDAAPANGRDETVAIFRGTHVYFGDGGSREVDIAAELPAAGFQYRSISLDMALRCPPGGGCDWWDRHGHISLVVAGREIEVLRFVTPYRKAMSVA